MTKERGGGGGGGGGGRFIDCQQGLPESRQAQRPVVEEEREKERVCVCERERNREKKKERKTGESGYSGTLPLPLRYSSRAR